MTTQENGNDHDHDHDEIFGMAMGFRIIDEEGALYLVEAEIAPYVDEPQELGASLVFHPLDGLDPSDETNDDEAPAWQIDIDDDLASASGSLTEQFQAIARQLRDFSEEDLRKYLRVAKE